MKLLINVDYTNGTAKNGKGDFWAESYIKNMEVESLRGETIHDTVKRIIENVDYAEVCYKGCPVQNVYIDTDEGQKHVGYIYRVKHYIESRRDNLQCYAYFDAWVHISQVKDIELESCGY